MYGLMRGTGLRFTEDSKRARSWKRRTQPRIDLIKAEPVLYSTLWLFLIWLICSRPGKVSVDDRIARALGYQDG